MRCAISAFVLLAASAADGRTVDWMEIGTNNFDTLLQTAMDGSVGVSVEAMRFYLDQLPSKEGVTKVNAAVVDVVSTSKPRHVIVSFGRRRRVRSRALSPAVRRETRRGA